MTSEPTTTVSLEPDANPDADPERTGTMTNHHTPSGTGTDWAYLEAMTDEENQANAGSDPDAVILTDEQRQRLRRVPDPRAIREQLGLTQEAFSRRFGIPVGTLRDWEQGRRFIDATGRALLRTIAVAPDIVAQANGPRDLEPDVAAPETLARTAD